MPPAESEKRAGMVELSAISYQLSAQTSRDQTPKALTAQDAINCRAELRELEGFLDDLAGRLTREIGGFGRHQIAGREHQTRQDLRTVPLDTIVQLDSREAWHPEV